MADIFTRIKEKYTEKQLAQFEAKAKELLFLRGLQESDSLLALIILTELAKNEVLSNAISEYANQQNTLDVWDGEFTE